MLTNLEESPRGQSSFLYGTLKCGADTWRSALGRGRQVFSFDSRLRSDDKSHRTNYYRTNWGDYPQLDLLVVMDNGMDKFHDHWMEDWARLSRARHMLVFHGIQLLTSFGGKGFKSWGKVIRTRGYETHTWHIDATKCGASLWSNYVVTFCYPKDSPCKFPLNLGNNISVRPCRNLIRTYGVSSSRYHPISSLVPLLHPTQKNLMGTLYGHKVYDWDGACGAESSKGWIHIPNFGIRHVLQDEMVKLKGVDNSTYTHIPLGVLYETVEQHVWATLCKAIAPMLSPVTSPPILHPTATQPPSSPPSYHHDSVTKPWVWSMPDLSIGKEFYVQRVANLRAAIAHLNLEFDSTFQEGLDILAAHRSNYGSEGPVHLVVLWWEWPQLHWNDLRTGATMNFMEIPKPGKVPNQDLKGPALAAAIQFVDELIALKVLCLPPSSVQIFNSFPLFLVPKPGQPGQFRTIADGKSGGQNEVCVADPCLMTNPECILPRMYTNGFSATLDLSKYFHMFLTDPSEHQYMGLEHPGTGLTYIYRTLPMGTRNSPGASGRFGAAFLRTVMDSSDLFHGHPVDNSLQQYFSKSITHPTHGEGRVLIGSDGLPVVLIWIHVDDILIHAPTLRKLEAALNHIMATTVRLGLICHPSKTSPPAQRVKFCGFEYDTSSTPTLHIPQSKISRAIAITSYILSDARPSLSRLVVSMVVGYLQSLVPATPGNIGAALLRPVYFDLHAISTNSLPNTKQAYFSIMDLSERSRLCLQWWVEALSCGLHKQSQPTDVATMGVTWGDGSGTGAGGTLNFTSPQVITTSITLEVWKGVWSPHVASFSSNWKEMRTLLQTLENEKSTGGVRVKNRRLLYFTDNMVTYDVFRRGSSKSTPLWKLFLDIKLLEIELGCLVQVIHVPGTSMILQGTDGLSRGVEMQTLGSYKSNSLVSLLWRAAPATPVVLNWILSVLPPLWPASTSWLFQTDFSDWSRSSFLCRSALWCISPSFARQAILQALSVWVESPTTNGHIFLVPRILQRDFGRLSKFVLYGGQFDVLPIPFEPLVPFVIYYLPPFDRRSVYGKQQLQHDGQLDTPTVPVPYWIQEQIDNMQRLSPCL